VSAAALLTALVVVHGTVTLDGKPARHALLEFTRFAHITLVTTDGRGRYATRLSPGMWNVGVVRATSWTPTRFVVRPGARTLRRDFVCSSGP